MTGNKTVNKLFRVIHDNKTCSLLSYIVTMWGILTTEKDHEPYKLRTRIKVDLLLTNTGTNWRFSTPGTIQRTFTTQVSRCSFEAIITTVE